MTRARAHHYVPQTYLRLWATDGQVAVRRRGSAASFVASTINVAQETDLYTVETEDGPSDLVERYLAEMERVLPDVLAAIRVGQIPGRGTPGRMLFASLLALQYVRTPDRIEEQRFPADALKAAGGSHPVPKDTIRGFLEERWGYPPQESEVQGAGDFVNYVLRDGQQMTNAEYLQTTFGTLPTLADRLAAMRWSTEVTKGGHFLTSDQPLTLWLKDPSPFRGAGIDSADEIRFPAGPRHLLVLRRTGRESTTFVTRARVASVNRHVAATCRQMVIAGRGEKTLLEDLPLTRLAARCGRSTKGRSTTGERTATATPAK